MINVDNLVSHDLHWSGSAPFTLTVTHERHLRALPVSVDSISGVEESERPDEVETRRLQCFLKQMNKKRNTAICVALYFLL